MKRLMVGLLAGGLLAAMLPGVATAECPEGCTPGYWKQVHHFDVWTGYEPDDSFGDVFGVALEAKGDRTLGEALRLKGGNGGLNQLARHAVAALLNASSPNVAYPLTEEEVIALVGGAAFAKGAAVVGGAENGVKEVLATYNENGCPLE